MSGNTANSAGAVSGRKGRPGPDAHGGDATTLAIAGFPQPALEPVSRGHPPARRAGVPGPPRRAGAAAGHVRGAAVMGSANADRAAWAAQAIEAFQAAAGDQGGLDTAEAIGSLITAPVPLRRPARHQLRRDPHGKQRCVPVPARQ